MWAKKGERRYVGMFGNVEVTLICPNTPSMPQQHDIWHLSMPFGGDDCPCVGHLGDEMEEVFARAEATLWSELGRALAAIKATGRVTL